MDRRTCLVAAVMLAVNGSAFAQALGDRSAAMAIKGYDPVAYFTDARAQKGSGAIAKEFDGLQYRFATVPHRELFAADPVRYLPQYQGHCTVNLAAGRKFEADPEQWVIMDGKLYLFGSAQARERFTQDPAALAKAAEQNWKGGGRR